jgi:peptidoglycan/LPS O-acetylase OafA/YrhL
MWTWLFFLGAVALITAGVIRGDHRGNGIDAVHSGIRILCLVFALGVIGVCVRNAVRRPDVVNAVAALFAVLGVAALVFEVAAASSAGPDDADIGGGGIVVIGFVAVLVAGAMTREESARD